MFSKLRCAADEKFNSAYKRHYEIHEGDSTQNMNVKVVFLCAAFDRDEPKGSSFILGQMVIYSPVVHIIMSFIKIYSYRLLSIFQLPRKEGPNTNGKSHKSMPWVRLDIRLLVE